MLNDKELFAEIVPAQAMGIELASYKTKELVLTAPLEMNSNDKGTFFAGSIYSTMVLSGWALVTMVLSDRGIMAEVVIATSTIDYTAPAKDDVESHAGLVDSDGIEKLLESIEVKGRGKILVTSELISGGVKCAAFSGTYVAKEVDSDKSMSLN